MWDSGLVHASPASHVSGARNDKTIHWNFAIGPARKEVNHLLNLIQALAARLKREEGQTIVEYGLVIGGISLVLITLFIVTDLGGEFTTLIQNIGDTMNP
jgi:Flp pilus assembly pilin Flp